MNTRPRGFASRSRAATFALVLAALAMLGVALTLHARTRTKTGLQALIAASRARGLAGRLAMEYPLDGTVFPPDIAAPLCKWRDESQGSDTWLVDVTAASGAVLVQETVTEASYRFTPEQWLRVQDVGRSAPVRITVLGFRRSEPDHPVSGAAVAITTSRDRVDAAIFFRQVPLPFDFANRHTERIRYSLGYVEGGRPPEVLLEGLPVCGNCHSFSRDGHTLGMDVDYANDKGSYVIAPLEAQTLLTPEKIITWSDYRREDGQLTFGLLSQISPDARYVMSTVKDRSIFVGLPDRLEYSQLFFPIRGILAFYDRTTRKFQALSGADDPSLVQSNPNWTPDGKALLFARTRAYHSAKVDASSGAILPVAAASEFLQGKQGFQYDICRIPFNDGAGGHAEPVPGASQNGMSNYFPRVSPDGKWLVYTQSKNFMLLQPDSKLFIVPAAGGTPRAMRCNTPSMNSWHSWSPSGRWLVFSSKWRGIYTQLWLTHVDEEGNDTPAVLLENLMSSERAANIPEFIATEPGFLHKLVDGFSDGGNYHYRVAKTMIHYNDLDAAAGRLELAIAREPNDPDVWLERGAVLFKLGKQQESFDSFRRAMEIAPKDYRGSYNLGISQLDSDRLPEAVESLSRAIELDAKVPQIWYQRALAHSRQADTTDALSDVREAIRLDPKGKELHRLAADLEQKSGDPAAAIADLDRAIELDPDYGAGWLNRSYAKLTLGDTSGAEQDWIAGSKLAPEDPLVNMIKASLAFAHGDPAAACKTLRDERARGASHAHHDEIDRVLAERCQ